MLRTYKRAQVEQPEFAARREPTQSWIARWHPLGNERLVRMNFDRAERLRAGSERKTRT